MSPPVQSSKTATVTVGGHAYRVTSTASSDELARLAALVDDRLKALPLNQRGDPRSLVLIALSLAHDLESEKERRAAERAQMSERVLSLLEHVDGALGHVGLEGEPLPPLTRSPKQPVPGVSPAASLPASAGDVVLVKSKPGNAPLKHHNRPGT